MPQNEKLSAPHILLLLFLTSLLCSCDPDDSSEIQEPTYTPNEQFSAMINNQYFGPGLNVTGRWYKNELTFNAHDILVSDHPENQYWMDFTIENPIIGVNKLGNTNGNKTVTLSEWDETSGSTHHSSSGEVIFTELDSLSGFSGTFSFEIDNSDGTYYAVTEGQFNDIQIIPNFCKPDYNYKKPDSLSIFNKWWVVGFMNENDSIYNPPCGIYGNIEIATDTSEQIFINASYVNGYWVNKVTTIDDERFLTSGAGGTLEFLNIPHENKFEGDFINFITNDTIKHQIIDDRLILSNTKSKLKLVLATIDGINY